MDSMNLHLCPVCGYDLGFAPWQGLSASDEICPCCHIQFGYDDCAGGQPEKRAAIYYDWRTEWIAEGMPWRGSRKLPEGWDPVRQLQAIGVKP